ncbi:MAG: hypothetical protein FWC89_05305, partial [Defluviitaleaceae bacterium]|nr:hypothetical protein [Defluviitaleaceae bacterium]
VLNPRWITGAVYKIVNWVQKSEIYNNASIKIFDFHNVLRSNAKDAVIFPEDKDELIFNIMKCFELAYSEDGETLIIPHCLKDSYPDEEVGLSFEFENSVQMEIAIIAKGDSPLPEFPSSLIPRFIVKNFNSIHKNAKGNSVTSKNKAMFVSVDGKSLAEIKRNDRDNYRVYITVQGKNGNINFEDNIKFLCSLESCLGDILREHKRFQEQKPTISYRATKIDGKPVYLPANELRVKELPTIESYKGEKFKKEENARVIMFVNNHFGGDMHMGNTFNAGGNIAQTTTKAEKGAKVKVTVNQNNVSQENLVELTKEINEAKNQITFVPELEIKQKNSLMQLLDAVKIAVEKDDENAKEKCKSKFELFKEIADVALGNALLIIGSFSHLAKFFGG